MKFKDARIAKLIEALERRFPGTTAITRPMPDAGIFDECSIQLLNAPIEPPTLVHDFSSQVIDKLWGDDPVPINVSAVSQENSAKYYAQYLPKPGRARTRRKRPAAVAATRSPTVTSRRRPTPTV